MMVLVANGVLFFKNMTRMANDFDNPSWQPDV